METMDLDKRLRAACDKDKKNLDEIKELIVAGADTNQLNECGDNIFESVFLEVLYDAYDDTVKLSIIVEKIKNLIQIMVDAGWDVKRFGASTMNQFKFSTNDRFVFDLYRFMLQYEVSDNRQVYEDILSEVGTEESYQRCCEHDHKLENVFYAIYEMIEAKMKGKNYESVEPYYNATGMKIDKIIYFDKTDSTVVKKDFIEFNADMGFVCENKVLVLRNGINILFMNDRLDSEPQIDISNMFEKGVINSRIQSVSFDHHTLIKHATHYGQPMICVALDNGRKIKFTHNFGELPDKKMQSRFWVE